MKSSIEPKHINMNEKKFLGYFYNWNPSQFEVDFMKDTDLSDSIFCDHLVSVLKFVLFRFNKNTLKICEKLVHILNKNSKKNQLKNFFIGILEMKEISLLKGIKKIPTFYQKICSFVSEQLLSLDPKLSFVIQIKLIEGMNTHGISKKNIEGRIKSMLESMSACNPVDRIELENEAPLKHKMKGRILNLMTTNSMNIQYAFFKTMIMIQKTNSHLLKEHHEYVVMEIMDLLQVITDKSQTYIKFNISVTGLALSIQLLKQILDDDLQLKKRFKLKFLKILRKLQKNEKRIIRKIAGFIKLEYATL
jgi:hypothetical protein